MRLLSVPDQPPDRSRLSTVVTGPTTADIGKSQDERRLIGQRTKEALDVKRAAGVQLLRPRVVPPHVARRIKNLRTRGHTLAPIARVLNDDQVATAHSEVQWHPSTVSAVLRSAQRH